ncbi:unnamed protein product [Rhizophagus irregularis]|nr:unnamed protein product [Rhizophagus irregularis]
MPKCIGVLLWEMLSGRPPFEYEDQYNLRTLISQGLRETPIPNTPKNYEMIYTGCWKHEPYDRPTIQERLANKISKYFLVNI